jgi:hypothetical protein
MAEDMTRRPVDPGRFVQIAVEGGPTSAYVYAVDDLGRVWVTAGKWKSRQVEWEAWTPVAQDEDGDPL